MGCIDSKNNPYAGSKDEKEASRKIDEMIRKDRKELEHEVKLLLLGTFSSPSPPAALFPRPPCCRWLQAEVLPRVEQHSFLSRTGIGVCRLFWERESPTEPRATAAHRIGY